MSTEPEGNSPPSGDPRSELPVSPPGNRDGYQPPATSESGCAFVGGVIGGFVLFIVGGGIALSLSGRGGAFAIGYLVVALGAAIALALKPGLRGLAVGIFLGLGAVLLLIAICSGIKF